MVETKYREKFPIGMHTKGIILKKVDFGIFIDLGEDINECLGLIAITDIDPEMFNSFNPKDPISIVIHSYTEDERNQIWLKLAD
tara:strand:+ start:136 stop:387 length:252 start_codon:yes stop_codon:yes gene_type:complete